MSKRIDLVGKRFGFIEILSYKECIDTHAVYNCFCHNCKSSCIKNATNLKSQNQQRCLKCSNEKLVRSKQKEIFNKYLIIKNMNTLVKITGLKLSVVRRIVKLGKEGEYEKIN